MRRRERDSSAASGMSTARTTMPLARWRRRTPGGAMAEVLKRLKRLFLFFDYISFFSFFKLFKNPNFEIFFKFKIYFKNIIKFFLASFEKLPL
jgi:hypothetical protein